MARRANISYRSRRALGKLYDRVVKVPANFTPERDRPFDHRILNQYEHNEETLGKVRQIKVLYDTAVRRILAQQNLDTEFELWTGYAMSKPAVGSDYKRWEDIGRENEALRARFREMCHEAIGSRARQDVEHFVSAMYKVTDEGRKEDEINGLVPLISFPWIFPEEMIRLAAGEYTPRFKKLRRAPQKTPPPMPKSISQLEKAAKIDEGSAEDSGDNQDGGCEVVALKDDDVESNHDVKKDSKAGEVEEEVQKTPGFYLSDLKGPLSELANASNSSIVTDEGLTNSEDAFGDDDDDDVDASSNTTYGVNINGNSGNVPKKRSAMDRLAELISSDEDEED